MKSPELKNIFIAAGIAVFAGVLVLGVNAAFGVSAPTVTPEGSGLVGPTFSEVTVNDDLDIGGTIKNSNVGDDGGDQPVVVDDLLWLNEPLFVHEIGDANRWGGLTISSLGDINIDPFGSIALNAPISTTANDIYGNPAALTIGDDVVIDGVIWSSVTEPANPDGNLRIGDTLAVAENILVEGGIDVGGVINNTRTDPSKPGSDFSVSIDDKFYVSGLTTFGNDVNINGDIDIINGNADIDGNLSVDGAITAQNFGSYRRYPSTTITVSAGQVGSRTVACQSGQIVISCGVSTTDNNTNTNVVVKYVYPNSTNNTCYAQVRNIGSDGTGSATAWAICLDPDAAM